MVTVLVRVRRLRAVPVLASPPAKTPLVHQKLQPLQLTVQCLILLCGRVEGSALLTWSFAEVLGPLVHQCLAAGFVLLLCCKQLADCRV